MENFINKFNERFLSETNIFYIDYCNNYYKNIKNEELNLKKNIIDEKKNFNIYEKRIFSYFDISILNYKSDGNDFNDEFKEIKKKNNLVKICSDNLKESNYNLNKIICEKKKFINKKISKDIFDIKSTNNIKQNNLIVDLDKHIINDSFLKNEDSIKDIDSNGLDCSTFKNEQYFSKKKSKKFINEKNFPISFEGFILEITLLVNLERNMYLNYNKKNDIENKLLDLCLLKNEKFIFENLKRLIEKSDFIIIKYTYLLFSKNDELRDRFNCILNGIINLILNDLEKNHTIVNKFNKIEYVNFLFFVEEIYEIKKKFFSILKFSLNNYSRSELMIKTCLEKVVNKNFDFMENFVKLIHDEIKIAIKNRNPHRLKDFQDKFLSIYKLFSEKDLFEIEYRKYLSKRLLRNSSMVRETEYEFFEILKKESGNNYTRKINKILEEISVSYDLNVEYSQKFEGNIRKVLSDKYKFKLNKDQILDCNLFCNKKFNEIKNEKKEIISSIIDLKNNSLDNKDEFNINMNLNEKKNIIDEKNIGNFFFKQYNLNIDKSTNSSNNLNNYCNKENLESSNSQNNLFLLNNSDSQSKNNLNINLIQSYNFSEITKSNNRLNKIFNNSLFNKIDDCKYEIIQNNSNSSGGEIKLDLSNNFNFLKEERIKTKHQKNFVNYIIDLNVKVVSSDSWLLENINIIDNKKINISEIKQCENFKLPLVLDKYIKNFTEFYCKKFNNRQLKWINEYSYAFIDFKNRKGKSFNLITSNFQMSFLCLFNNRNLKEINFKDILEKLDLVDYKESSGNKIENNKFLPVLKSHLIPIFNYKLFLIKNKEKVEDLSEIELNDVIYLNEDFDHEDKKLKLLSLIIEKKEMRSSKNKKFDEINHFVLEDRKYQLDSLIMKFLKHNKVLEFEKLRNLLNLELKKYFIPETKFIKIRLENLIDRNFIKRNENNLNCYEYI